jgi:hypothetical protein
MHKGRITLAAAILSALLTGPVVAERFQLLTGVDAGRWPAPARNVDAAPGPGYTGTFYDGDRLAGTLPQGAAMDFQGSGTPTPELSFLSTNGLGCLSFVFKRASVPIPGTGRQLPWMGIDFLGGPLLDLDGNAGDGSRRLIPDVGVDAVPMPGTTSYIDLALNTSASTVVLNNFDVTGVSEGSWGISWEASITLNLIAGTDTNGVQSGPINPEIDTRQGSLTPFTGAGGRLSGVYRVDDLGYEFWQDTLLANSSTAYVLGTFQYLGTFRGWLVERDPQTGLFPTLAGQGLGTTGWPIVDTSGVGLVLNTANGLAGGTAVIGDGPGQDEFTASNNGGLALADFGGDLGAYLDQVVAPRVHLHSPRFVYLQSTGMGLNNSADPVYVDSIGYDVVLIAQAAPSVDGDVDRDGDVDLVDFAAYQRCFTGPGPATLGPSCDLFDFDFDLDVDLTDYRALATRLTGP